MVPCFQAALWTVMSLVPCDQIGCRLFARYAHSNSLPNDTPIWQTYHYQRVVLHISPWSYNMRGGKSGVWLVLIPGKACNIDERIFRPLFPVAVETVSPSSGDFQWKRHDSPGTPCGIWLVQMLCSSFFLVLFALYCTFLVGGGGGWEARGVFHRPDAITIGLSIHDEMLVRDAAWPSLPRETLFSQLGPSSNHAQKHAKV